MKIEFTPVESDRLFHSRWKYCACIGIKNASTLRPHRKTDQITADKETIIQSLKKRRKWDRDWGAMWTQNRVQPGVSIRVPMDGDVLTGEDLSNANELFEFVDLLQNPAQAVKLIFYSNRVYVYTNELKLLSALNDLPSRSDSTASQSSFIDRKFTQAVITREKGTIVRHDPQHQHRTYFRSSTLTPEQKRSLVSFFKANAAEIRLSPELANWVDTERRTWIRYSHFIDHDSMSHILMLNLISAKLVRSTIDIIAHK